MSTQFITYKENHHDRPQNAAVSVDNLLSSLNLNLFYIWHMVVRCFNRNLHVYYEYIQKVDYNMHLCSLSHNTFHIVYNWNSSLTLVIPEINNTCIFFVKASFWSKIKCVKLNYFTSVVSVCLQSVQRNNVYIMK